MRAALLAFAIACGGSTPATVTLSVAPLPQPPAHDDTPPPLTRPAPANAEAAPEVLAPSKVTVVHFFASRCAPCAKSMPELEALYVAHHGRVAVIGIGEDENESDMRAFVAQARASFTVVSDSANAKAQRWRMTTMPTTFIVDKHGALRFTHAGYNDAQSIDEEIRALLAEP